MKNKKDMIKWLNNLKSDIGQPQHSQLWHYAEILDVVVKYLEVSEPVNGGWIPVSERMPGPSFEQLLVSGYIKIGSLKTFATDMAIWNGDDWTFGGKPIPDVVVLARMPLPEPWRGENDD